MHECRLPIEKWVSDAHGPHEGLPHGIQETSIAQDTKRQPADGRSSDSASPLLPPADAPLPLWKIPSLSRSETIKRRSAVHPQGAEKAFPLL